VRFQRGRLERFFISRAPCKLCARRLSLFPGSRDLLAGIPAKVNQLWRDRNMAVGEPLQLSNRRYTLRCLSFDGAGHGENRLAVPPCECKRDRPPHSASVEGKRAQEALAASLGLTRSRSSLEGLK
jgi:hypothetical protein